MTIRKTTRFIGIVALGLMQLSAYALELDLSSGRSDADKARDLRSKPVKILALADIKPGMVVADVLGGGGYYSELISQLVGEKGKVYLHNNKAYMPYVEKQLVERLANNRLPNVIRHDRETDNLELPKAGVDAVFFVMGYHDIYHVSDGWKIDKLRFLSQIRDALNTHGKLIVIDHDARSGTGIADSQELHRIEEKYVTDELKSLGFTLKTTSSVLKNPDDQLTLSAFDKHVRGKTSRFVLVFEKA